MIKRAVRPVPGWFSRFTACGGTAGPVPDGAAQITCSSVLPPPRPGGETGTYGGEVLTSVMARKQPFSLFFIVFHPLCITQVGTSISSQTSTSSGVFELFSAPPPPASARGLIRTCVSERLIICVCSSVGHHFITLRSHSLLSRHLYLRPPLIAHFFNTVQRLMCG